MPVIEITDINDPRIADYTHLTDLALRRSLEVDRGLYMAESANVIRRALKAGHRPRSFLLLPRYLDKMADVWERVSALPEESGAPCGDQIPIFVGDESLLEKITGFHLHRGAIAAMQRPVLPDPRTLIETAREGRPARRVAVLDGLVDHTNVGAAFRAAAAMGVDAVLVTPSCADPLYRRSVRVSMGTVFQVPWTRLEAWPHTREPKPNYRPKEDEVFPLGGAEILKQLDFEIAALALKEDSVSLDDYAAALETDSDRKVALVLGPEGYGLSDRVIAACDLSVIIPMQAGVDSLNVASAGAVAFWATRAK